MPPLPDLPFEGLQPAGEVSLPPAPSEPPPPNSFFSEWGKGERGGVGVQWGFDGRHWGAVGGRWGCNEGCSGGCIRHSLGGTGGVLGVHKVLQGLLWGAVGWCGVPRGAMGCQGLQRGAVWGAVGGHAVLRGSMGCRGVQQDA